MAKSLVQFDYGVFFGRFQPLHAAHEHVIRETLSHVGTLVIGIGSTNVPRTPVNPFTFDERVKMLTAVFRHELTTKRMVIVPIDDIPDDNSEWASYAADVVESAIEAHAGKDAIDVTIALAGYAKDESSFYLDLFPDWHSINLTSSYGTLSATYIRKAYFKPLPFVDPWAVSPPIADQLRHFSLTEEFKALVAEAEHYAEYESRWGKGPHLTADTVLLHVGTKKQVLLVTRGDLPGKGLLALPGGFLNAGETFKQAAKRELKEETGIDLVGRAQRRFGPIIADNPRRSLRGRVISVAQVIELLSPNLPEVKGADDAAHAAFYDVEGLDPRQMFDDHFYVIRQALRLAR